jgi:hypothetical protein
MKKYIIGILIVIILSLSVLGANNANVPAPKESWYDKQDNRNDINTTEMKYQTQNTMTEQLQKRLKLTGLENAMVRVQNEEAQNRLSSVMEKMQAKDQRRLKEMSQVKINQTEKGFMAEGKKESKLKILPFIKFERTHKFHIMEDGSIIREKNQLDWLFQEEI